MEFWIPVAVVTLIAVIWPLWPLLRQEKDAPALRASYDIQVFKDQLKEIDSDETRGVMTEAEAGRIRTEVSRRLLAAAKESESETPDLNAPRSATLGLAAIISLAVVLGGLGLYRNLGAPGYSDLPLSENLAQRAAAENDRPSQDQMEAFITAQLADSGTGLPSLEALTEDPNTALLAELAEVLKDRPNDLAGHQMLARNLASSGRMIEARAAQDKVIAILGENATPDDFLEQAELMILAAQGYVSPQAIAALEVVMAEIPENPRARYYAGLALGQYGRPREGYAMWVALLQDSPADAPWVPAIQAGLADMAEKAGIAAQAPGPSQEQVEAASEMTDEERSEMIRSMVSQLTERLSAEGGSVEEWVRLIGANMVLGEATAAEQAFIDAKAAHAGDAAALARIEAAGEQLQ